ncbi:hypothetical protein K1719_025543 [Acacia pycnantha]|nr:hypothetical protein K1719_025543 [Acacia pycnantha]
MEHKEKLSVKWRWSWLLALVFTAAFVVGAQGGNVTYDGRSLIINGKHEILFSGSIHYPRSTPEMWPSLISKAKEGGIDVIQTYVFWNQHEHLEGQYDFSGRRDIVRFIKEIQSQGLYVTLRIGPFIQSEWTYGGLPIWLHDVPGIVFRSDNEPFKYHMKKFTTHIVNSMKSHNLFASQGGPIILSQIENEYGMIEAAYGEGGPRYVRWAAQMAVGLQTGVPWVMCKQDDAPDPVINACNGMECGRTFKGPNSPDKPSIWTENWTSFYQAFGDEPYLRSAENIAYSVALFIAKKGSYVNYYMYHGGTNFGRTAAAFMVTAYYDEAPLDEYGLIRQPKWGHLRDLHAAIKSCSKTLLSATPTTLSLGGQQQAYVFRKSKTECAAFLENRDQKEVTVRFQSMAYKLPPQSISILPDCKSVAFNTAQVRAKHSTRTMNPVVHFQSAQQWKVYNEAIPNFGRTISRANGLVDQISKAKDKSDYMWYTLRFSQSSSQSLLSATSHGHVLHAFVNGDLAGSAHGSHDNISFTLKSNIKLREGVNHISFLSATVGLPDSGAYLEHKVAGLRNVRVGDTDFTWYKTTFDAPPGIDPVALDHGSMGKGQVWVNGESLGRYWVSFVTPKGNPSQRWYHIPRSLLKPSGNLLVLFEEETGNPLRISLDTVTWS